MPDHKETNVSRHLIPHTEADKMTMAYHPVYLEVLISYFILSSLG